VNFQNKRLTIQISNTKKKALLTNLVPSKILKVRQSVNSKEKDKQPTPFLIEKAKQVKIDKMTFQYTKKCLKFS
jgi:hypothetical protein